MKTRWFISLRAINLVMIVTGLGLMLFSGWQLQQSVRALKATPVDNVLWNLSQLEVDFLKLELAASRVAEDDPASIRQFRKWFDVYYSRVYIIDTSSAVEKVHEDPHLHHMHENLKAFLEEAVDLIDGPDARLMRNLPDFMALLPDVTIYTRQLSLGGIEISSEIADEKRLEIERILSVIALAAPMTFLGLIFALVLQKVQKNRLDRQTREISAANLRFSSTLRASLDAIVVIDADGVITDFNGSAEKVFGYSKAEIVGQRAAETIIPHQYREAHSRKFTTFQAGQSSEIVDAGRLELEALHRDGHMFPVEISITETVGEDGPNFVSYIRDISTDRANQIELQQARDDALAATREKSKFFAMMSHEMRTPLNGIMSSLDLIKDGKLDQSQQRYVDIAEISSQTLLNHVNDVLVIERLDAGERNVQTEQFNVRQQLSTLIDTLRPLAAQRNNSLTVAHVGPEPDLVGDLRGVQQVFTNLVGNAIKFTASGEVAVQSTIEIVDEKQAMLKLQVEDTGIGILEEDLEHIFDDFVTIEWQYERTSAGTGLGLGIVRRLLRGMGGTIHCSSKVGKGSRFTVDIPMKLATSQLNDTTTEELPEPVTPKAKLQILLVEDNPINRELLEAMIRRQGHEVSTAEDGFEGVHKANSQYFDLILMDISMPNMNGVEATRNIRAAKTLSSKTSIYAVTAHAMPHEIAEFTKSGMDGCMTKPIDAGELNDLLTKITNDRGYLETGSRKPGVSMPETDFPRLLDDGQIDELVVVLGREKAQKLFVDFCADGEARLKEIHAHAFDGKLSDLQAVSHKLAGSCAAFGALKMRDQLHQIEAACKENNLETAKTLTKTLNGVWAATLNTFQVTFFSH